MVSSVGSLIGGALGVLAVVLGACGLFLVFLDLNRADDDTGAMRRRLAATWRALLATPVGASPTWGVAAVVGAADRFVAYWFEQSEKNVATSGLFTLVVLVVIQPAALVNWLQGGSPFLILFILSCALGIVALATLSEMRIGEPWAALLAPLLFAAIFLFVPGYVFVSLTDRALNMPIGHAALTSILIVPLLYLVCHSAVLIGAGAWGLPVPSTRAAPVRRLATLCAAGLPVAYLAVFASLVVGHVAVPEAEVPSTWPALLIGMAAGALSAAATIHLARGRAPLVGLAIATAIGVALAAIVGAGAGDWPAAIPLAAPVALWAVALLAFLAKVVLGALGAERATGRPYLAAGALGLVLAIGTGWAAVVL